MHLRPLEPTDLDVLYEIENDMTMWHAGHTNVPFSRAILAEYIVNQKADIYMDGQVRLVLEDKGEVVGLADLVNFDSRDLRAEVSIIIRKEKQGRGYATEAIQQLIAYARDIILIEQLYAIVAESNKSSLALFRKCGFVQTAVLESWVKRVQNRENAHLFQLFLKK